MTRRTLIMMCQRRGWSPEDAEDLVQDAYVRLLDYERGSIVRDEATFLRRIVSNLSINLYRRGLIVSFAPIDEADEGALIDIGPEPYRILAAQQQLDKVARLLSAVSARTTRIFLAHRAGFRYSEIAQELGISQRTVRKHIARATSMLANGTYIE